MRNYSSLITGNAILKIDELKIEALISIDLENGIIRCFPKISFNDFHQLSVLTCKCEIIEFTAQTVNGEVSIPRIDNLSLLKYHKADVENKLYGRLLRQFEFLEDYESQELWFRLNNSQLILDAESANDMHQMTEIHFDSCWIQADFQIPVFNYQANIQCDGSGHAICVMNKDLSEKEINAFSRIFRLSYGLAQGKYPSIRQCISNTKLILNVSMENLKSKSRVYVRYSCLLQLFEQVIKLNKNNQSFSKIDNAVYYLENGLNQDINVEFRCVSLFIAYEILDGSDTLDKNILMKDMEFKTKFDAVVAVKLRGNIVHDGLSMRKAVKKAVEDNQENDKNESELIWLFQNIDYRNYMVVYHFLVDKLYKKLMEELDFDAPLNYHFKKPRNSRYTSGNSNN